MVNTELLNRRIKESGLKKQYIASNLGMSEFSLIKKIGNVTEFKTSEVTNLCALLKITSAKEKVEIFLSKG